MEWQWDKFCSLGTVIDVVFTLKCVVDYFFFSVNILGQTENIYSLVWDLFHIILFLGFGPYGLKHLLDKIYFAFTCHGLARRPRHGCCWLAESGASCGHPGPPGSTCDPPALKASLYPVRQRAGIRSSCGLGYKLKGRGSICGELIDLQAGSGLYWTNRAVKYWCVLFLLWKWKWMKTGFRWCVK